METACRNYQIGSDVQAFRGSDARTERRTACLPACQKTEISWAISGMKIQ